MVIPHPCVIPSEINCIEHASTALKSTTARLPSFASDLNMSPCSRLRDHSIVNNYLHWRWLFKSQVHTSHPSLLDLRNGHGLQVLVFPVVVDAHRNISCCLSFYMNRIFHACNANRVKIPSHFRSICSPKGWPQVCTQRALALHHDTNKMETTDLLSEDLETLESILTFQSHALISLAADISVRAIPIYAQSLTRPVGGLTLMLLDSSVASKRWWELFCLVVCKLFV